jgi:hypothetical protein
MSPTLRARPYTARGSTVVVANPHDAPIRVNLWTIPAQAHLEIPVSDGAVVLAGTRPFLAATIHAGAVIPAADMTRPALAPVAFPPIPCTACRAELLFISISSVPASLQWRRFTPDGSPLEAAR